MGDQAGTFNFGGGSQNMDPTPLGRGRDEQSNMGYSREIAPAAEQFTNKKNMDNQDKLRSFRNVAMNPKLKEAANQKFYGKWQIRDLRRELLKFQGRNVSINCF